MPDFECIYPGHGPYPARRQTGTCPSGKAYYVCAAGPFKGCCSSDPCSTGWCEDYPHEPGWRATTATESITQTQTQTTIGSYTTTVTMTLSTLSSATSGGTVTSTMSASSSITSSRSLETTLTDKASSTTHKSSSTASPFLSVNTAAHQNGTSTSSPHAGTVAGIALGSAGTVALFILFCCICCRRKKKNGWSFKYNKEEDKELKQQLKEAAAIQVERNKALRVLENRKRGTGSDGAWASSPRHSTGFPGIRGEG